MADYPISNVPRRVQYVNSGVGPYAFTFEILVQTDIAVYRGSTLLTLTTDYTVAINANGTGSITLVAAGTGNITIVGARAIQRSSDYTTGGDLFASTLNTDLDSQTIYSQQLAENLDRTVKVPVTDASTLNMELPSSTTRANKVFAFDPSGRPTVSTNTLAAIDSAVDAIESIAGAPSGSSAGISYISDGTNAVARTVQAKLRESVSPQDFGAVGNGVADDTTAVQNFFDYIQTNNVGTAYCDGNFLISSGITMGRTGEMLTKHIVGNASFTTAIAIDTMLTVRNCPDLVWDGKVSVTGTGGSAYAGRTCRIGITIAGQGQPANRMRFGGLIAQRFNQVGINVQELSTLTDLGNIRVSDCGSGFASSGYSLLANWSDRVDTGSSGTTGQRTTIDVDQLPPSQFTGSRNPNCFVVINNETYYVYGVDTVNSTITVFPWIDLNVTSGSLRYLFGGGVLTHGGDAGILGINQLDAVRCSFGLITTALYGPIVSRFVTQSCGVGFGFGGAPEGASVTFQLNGFYCEGNNFDILRVTRATVGGIIASSYALNFGKITYTSDSRLTANTYANGFNNMRSIAIYQNGILNQFKQGRKNTANNGSTLSLNVTDSPLNNQYKRDSWTINLVRPSISNNDTFGYNSDTVTIVGTGVNFAPTGTFTFNAPTSTSVTTTGSGTIDRVELTVADTTGILRGQDVTGTGITAGTVVVQISGDEVILSQLLTATITNSSVTFANTVATTVNGGATAAFNGFNGPAVFSVYYDFAADNFIVNTTSVGSFPSTTAANIADIANIFNTQSKYLGRGVYDTTNNRLMIASGSNANSPWYVADGSASVTPA